MITDELTRRSTAAMTEHMATDHQTYKSGLHVFDLLAEHHWLHLREHRDLDHEAAHDRVTASMKPIVEPHDRKEVPGSDCCCCLKARFQPWHGSRCPHGM